MSPLPLPNVMSRFRSFSRPTHSLSPDFQGSTGPVCIQVPSSFPYFSLAALQPVLRLPCRVLLITVSPLGHSSQVRPPTFSLPPRLHCTLFLWFWFLREEHFYLLEGPLSFSIALVYHPPEIQSLLCNVSYSRPVCPPNSLFLLSGHPLFVVASSP